jgi:hypothetical protein
VNDGVPVGLEENVGVKEAVLVAVAEGVEVGVTVGVEVGDQVRLGVLVTVGV